MNALVQQLAVQAMGTRKHRPPTWQFYEVELQEFARLVALECAEIADQYDGVGITIANKIKQRFEFDK